MKRYIKASTTELAAPYDIVYDPISRDELRYIGYGWEPEDDAYFKEIFEENGYQFAGYAVAMDPYYDRCADDGEDLVCYDTNGICYLVVDDRLIPAQDWYNKLAEEAADEDWLYDNYIESTKVIPTYVAQLPEEQQESIRNQLESCGIHGQDLEDAMNSKISDITGNPECPIDIGEVKPFYLD